MFDQILELNANINGLFEYLETNIIVENPTYETNTYNTKRDQIIQMLRNLIESKPDELSASQIFYPVM
jgi:hypothetical protein